MQVYSNEGVFIPDSRGKLKKVQKEDEFFFKASRTLTDNFMRPAQHK